MAKEKLASHLIVETYPLANPANVIVWKDYRITVLDSGLFRLEHSKKGVFRDDATQTVWYRNMSKQAFETKYTDNQVVVSTSRCRLIIKENREDCRIDLNGKVVPLTNDGNLLGTYRTLDCCNGNRKIWGDDKGKIRLGMGVCSKTGVAVLDDSASLTLNENGEIAAGKADGLDEYIFAYGNDYRGAVRALYMITGSTPLVPRFALGNWWSRYHAYTQDEYIRLMNVFEERNIPLTVATVDMDWHYSWKIDEELGLSAADRKTEYYCGDMGWGIGWTGYTWNKNLFPDYKQFLKDLKAKGLKVTLNLHPAQGVRYWEDAYEDMGKALGIDTSDGKQIPFSIADTKFINAYFKYLHKPFEDDGVDFWWMDWQQGTSSEMVGLDPLWALNHYHYYDNAHNHFSPMFLSRYSGVGSHRYPLGFSGDTYIEWETLDYLPYFTATASNVGYTWWSHDIGGHMNGRKNDELYVRMLQFGVFSPVNRLHGMDVDVLSKEPWLYENGAGLIAAEWLRLRHSLIPYLYAASYRTHTKGKALIEPLYYEWDTPKAYEYKNEYLFGGQLLVAPITAPADKDGFARTRVWLPEGKWTDIFTGDSYLSPVGGKEWTVLRKMESMPVFARAGGILPLSKDKGNVVDNPENLDICVWSGDGEFALFEDGRTQENTRECITQFTSKLMETDGACMQSLQICTSGDTSVIPKERTLRVLFKDVDWEKEVTVYKNGEKLALTKCLIDCAAIRFAFEPSANYEVQVRFTKETPLETLQKRAKEVLLRAEYSNGRKQEIYKELCKTKSVTEFVCLITGSELPEGEKQRLLETL